MVIRVGRDYRVDKIGEGDEEVQTSYKISHGDVMYSTRNTVNNIVISLYGDGD